MAHVLIIEDEPVIADVLRCLLEEEGATSFDLAETEEAAVAAALAHRPDIITSDVKLVAGTGPRAVSTIHDRLGDIPVIFITATPAECKPCNPPGRILCKPIDFGELAKTYHELTGH
jgi:CheY-like chemotaxis protein